MIPGQLKVDEAKQSLAARSWVFRLDSTGVDLLDPRFYDIIRPYENMRCPGGSTGLFLGRC